MDYIYILEQLNDKGIRRPVAAAATRTNLVAIADKLVTAYVKDGFMLSDIVVPIDDQPGDSGPYKAYVLLRTATKKHPLEEAFLRLELYELPIDTEATYNPDTSTIWTY